MSLRGNKASQIYYDKCAFAACYYIPKVDNDNVHSTLLGFQTDFGIPENLTMDGAAVQVGRHTGFQKTIRANEIYFHVSHPR